MKSFFAAVLCLFSFTQIHGSVLSSFESELSTITSPVTSEVGDIWRQYVIGLASLETSLVNNVLYAILNGTSGSVTGWLKLSSPLSSLLVTRFLINTTDIGDLLELTLVNSLNDGLLLKYIELDTRGALLFSDGLALNYNGASGQGYGYANFQIPLESTVANVLNGVTSSTALLNTLLNAQLVTNTVTLLLQILSPILGLLGGL